MDQPTAEDALRRFDPLVGEWTLEATPPGGDPWPDMSEDGISYRTDFDLVSVRVVV